MRSSKIKEMRRELAKIYQFKPLEVGIHKYYGLKNVCNTFSYLF